MSYELIIKPLARVDILDAFDWYEEQREGLGARFLNKVELAIAAIENHPLGYQVIDKKYGARRNLARPFPYMIVYTIEDNTIFVHSVVHSKRHRKAWRDRL